MISAISSNRWPSMLDDAELNLLDRYLRDHDGEGRLLLDGVHGLLSALAVGPRPALPQEWLPQVLHEPFADKEEGQRVLALLAKLNDSILAELDVDAYGPILGELEDQDSSVLSAAGWCEGFSRGIDLRASLWDQRLSNDPSLMELLSPIMALAVDEGVLSAEAEFEQLDEEDYENCLNQLPMALASLAHYWRQQPPTDSEKAAAQFAQQQATRVPVSVDENATRCSRRGHQWLH